MNAAQALIAALLFLLAVSVTTEYEDGANAHSIRYTASASNP